MHEQYAEVQPATAAAQLSAVLAEILADFTTPTMPHNWNNPDMLLPIPLQ